MASFVLHTFYRSSCAGRLRIALNLKGLSYESVNVGLNADEHRSSAYLDLNPNGTVPVLTDLRPASGGFDFPIGQSVAALEYLEETCPNTYSLLPPVSEPLQRAKVRALVNIIACDIQPITSRRMTIAVQSFGQSSGEWQRKHMSRGLGAFEKTASKTAGIYSVGDSITLADILLVPAVWNAEYYGVDLGKTPLLSKIFKRLSRTEAVNKAHWRVQPDTPTDSSW